MGTEMVNSEARGPNSIVLENPHAVGFSPADSTVPPFSWDEVTSTKVLPPTKPRNIDRRPREYLTHDEVSRVIQGAQHAGRHRYRDALLIHVAYRHALRVSELTLLRWNQVDFAARTLHVVRNKGGISGPHPLQDCTIRGLRELRPRYPDSPYLFVSERKQPLTRWRVGLIVARAGVLAGLDMPVHPHMLRHAAGYKLANEGWSTRDIQEYLGHKYIGNSVRYTQLAPGRFKRFWTD